MAPLAELKSKGDDHQGRTLNGPSALAGTGVPAKDLSSKKAKS